MVTGKDVTVLYIRQHSYCYLNSGLRSTLSGLLDKPCMVMLVSPVEPALLPSSPRVEGFHVLIIGLPQGRDKEE